MRPLLLAALVGSALGHLTAAVADPAPTDSTPAKGPPTPELLPPKQRVVPSAPRSINRPICDPPLPVVSMYRDGTAMVLHLRGRCDPGLARVRCQYGDHELSVPIERQNGVCTAIARFLVRGMAPIAPHIEEPPPPPVAPPDRRENDLERQCAARGAPVRAPLRSSFGDCQLPIVIQGVRDDDGSLLLFLCVGSDELMGRFGHIRFTLGDQAPFYARLRVLGAHTSIMSLPPGMKADQCELVP
jgi:hypothetical protein